MVNSVSANTVSHTPPTSNAHNIVALAAAAQNAVAKATSQTAAAITTVAAAVHQAVIGPLPTQKTVTMTIVPDWSQIELKSPLRPATITVVFGPPNTLPKDAPIKISFNVYSIDQLSDQKIKSNEKIISKQSRALLWHKGPFATYKDGINLSETLTSGTPAADELKLVSVVLRKFSEEKIDEALVWSKSSNKPKDSYLRVIQGHHYYLNFTFDAGSMIAQRVGGDEKYRPIVYLETKDANGNTTKSSLFTNYVTNWAQGVESPPNAKEEQEAQEAIQASQQQTVPLPLPIASQNGNASAQTPNQNSGLYPNLSQASLQTLTNTYQQQQQMLLLQHQQQLQQQQKLQQLIQKLPPQLTVPQLLQQVPPQQPTLPQPPQLTLPQQLSQPLLSQPSQQQLQQQLQQYQLQLQQQTQQSQLQVQQLQQQNQQLQQQQTQKNQQLQLQIQQLQHQLLKYQSLVNLSTQINVPNPNAINTAMPAQASNQAPAQASNPTANMPNNQQSSANPTNAQASKPSDSKASHPPTVKANVNQIEVRHVTSSKTNKSFFSRFAEFFTISISRFFRLMRDIFKVIFS